MIDCSIGPDGLSAQGYGLSQPAIETSMLPATFDVHNSIPPHLLKVVVSYLNTSAALNRYRISTSLIRESRKLDSGIKSFCKSLRHVHFIIIKW